MTCEEFSNEFDILYNNIMSNQAPGLDEYEKSVFLTRAQDDIVKRYFTAKGNKDVEGFDSSIKRNIDFSLLYNKYEISFDDLKKIFHKPIASKILKKVQRAISGAEIVKDDNTNNIHDITNDPIKTKDFKSNHYVYPKDEGDFICITQTGITDANYTNGIFLRINPSFLKKASGITNENVSLNLVNALVINGSDIESLYEGHYHLKNKDLFTETAFDVTNINYTNVEELFKNVAELTYEIDDLFLPINDEILVKESATNRNKILQVLPISTIEYIRMMSKPFKQPLKNQAWKLQDQQVSNSPTVKLIYGYNNLFQQYTLRYLVHPTPIILSPLASTDLSINGYKGSEDVGELSPSKTSKAIYPLTCKLSKEIHSEILQRAVELAKAAYLGDLSSTVQIGSVSSTNLGQVNSVPQNNDRYSRQ